MKASISRTIVCAVTAGAAVVVIALTPAAHAEDEIAITVHHGYGTRKHFVVEGRVAERNGERESRPGDPWYANLWRSLRSFRVDEEKRIPLLLTLGGHTWELGSDDDGYFTLRGETPAQAAPGWQTLHVEVASVAIRTDYPLLIVPDGEVLGIISDVDDTVVVSDVADRSRLLAHTFLENYLQRRAIPGVADFYRSIAARNALPDATPVIYLTATPRHLLPSLTAFLEHSGFPPGPILAKKVTDGAGGDPLLDQERYKLARIEAILADLPEVRFVLSGDDGERDPEVFQAIRERHPLRIDAVYIRKVNQDPSRRKYEGQQSLP